MSERTARWAALGALALFMAVGLIVTHRPLPEAAAVTAGTFALAVVAALLRLSSWRLVGVVAVMTIGVTYLGHGQASTLVWFSLCVLAGWVALTSEIKQTVVTVGLMLAVFVEETLMLSDEPGWGAWSAGTVFTAVACALGRRQRLLSEDLRRAQADLAERARADERARMAGEIHDVIGHALTVSLLHISSARLALDDDPDEARASLTEAEELARKSLEEVRATVGLMRPDNTREVTPLPDATAIAGLVDSFRRAGAEIALRVDGDLGSLGSVRGLAAYRIVQEALTNATKHAPGEPVDVSVAVDGDVTITVANGGAIAGEPVAGSGLRGMHERAVGVGGSLSAGPSADGWMVEAVLPA